MGVSRAFEFLKDRYSPKDVVPKQFDSHLHIDFNSVFIGYVQATLQSLKLKNFRRPSAKRKSPNELFRQLGRLLDSKLGQAFSKNAATLHFDGSYTIEKERAHQIRLEEFKLKYNVAEDSITKSLELIRDTSASGIITSSQRAKIIRHSRNAAQVWRSASPWSLDAQSRGLIVGVLREFGWDAHMCRGEADTCISKQGHVVVVSTDSDYLFRNVDILLRKDPSNHSKYSLYDINDVVSTLGISRNAWKVVGITSGNDYSANIPRSGIFRNFTEIASREYEHHVNVDHILQEYCINHHKDSSQGDQTMSRFENALRVFGKDTETICDEQSSTRSSSDIDPMMQNLSDEVSELLIYTGTIGNRTPSPPHHQQLKLRMPHCSSSFKEDLDEDTLCSCQRISLEPKNIR